MDGEMTAPGGCHAGHIWKTAVRLGGAVREERAGCARTDPLSALKHYGTTAASLHNVCSASLGYKYQASDFRFEVETVEIRPAQVGQVGSSESKDGQDTAFASSGGSVRRNGSPALIHLS